MTVQLIDPTAEMVEHYNKINAQVVIDLVKEQDFEKVLVIKDNYFLSEDSLKKLFSLPISNTVRFKDTFYLNKDKGTLGLYVCEEDSFIDGIYFKNISEEVVSFFTNDIGIKLYKFVSDEVFKASSLYLKNEIASKRWFREALKEVYNELP